MPNQSWEQTLSTQQAAGVLKNTFTAAQSVLNPQAVLTLPSGFFDAPGKMARVRVCGAISNKVTTPGLVTFQLMLGAIAVWSSGAIQLNATSHVLQPFVLDLLLTCQAVGSGTTAKLVGMATLAGKMFTVTAGQTDGLNSQSIIVVPDVAPAQGNGFDSTAAQILDFYVAETISDVLNGIQVSQFAFESIN